MGQWYVSVLLELDFDVLLPPLQHNKIIFLYGQAGVVGGVTLVVSVVVVVAAEVVMMAVLIEGGGVGGGVGGEGVTGSEMDPQA